MVITKEFVENSARKLGFDLVGFAEATELTTESERLAQWLTGSFNAGMKYMSDNTEKRRDVRSILPGAQSIISLGMNYYTGYRHGNADPDSGGKVSRYGWGRDYHLVMWEKLEILKEMMQQADPSCEMVYYVDTGPVMDKAWAVRAGLGWMGKNSNVISRRIGSWFFIATVITNCGFSASAAETDHCGSCTRCIDACPTNAIIQDGVIDANKCISYLTIENKHEIDESFSDSFDGWIFGCDICQEVCPWNVKFASDCGKKEFEPVSPFLKFDEIASMTNSEFRRRFSESPISRARLKGLRRNAAFLRGV